jgi:hypothetical protein
MAEMEDIENTWNARRQGLLSEFDVVQCAIQRRFDDNETSQASKEWLEKLISWRDDLEKLLAPFSDKT